jgi:hypothetical protein
LVSPCEFQMPESQANSNAVPTSPTVFLTSVRTTARRGDRSTITMTGWWGCCCSKRALQRCVRRRGALDLRERRPAVVVAVLSRKQRRGGGVTRPGDTVCSLGLQCVCVVALPYIVSGKLLVICRGQPHPPAKHVAPVSRQPLSFFLMEYS